MNRGIYVIGPDGGPWKVGSSDRKTHERLRGLQAGSAVKLSLAYAHPVHEGTSIKVVESYVHNLLASSHIRGEWFSASLDEIKLALVTASVEIGEGKSLPRVVGGAGRHGKNDHSTSMLLRFRPKLRETFDAVLLAGEDRTGAITRLIEDEIVKRGGTLPPADLPVPPAPRKRRTRAAGSGPKE